MNTRSIARVLPMPQPDPDNPLPYLSFEEQAEQSISIDKIARKLAEERTGKHLDDLPVDQRCRYETAATIAWLWLDTPARYVAREEAVQELTDQAHAEGVNLLGYGADFARCVVDAYERVLSGLAPITEPQYAAAQAEIEDLNLRRQARGWGRL